MKPSQTIYVVDDDPGVSRALVSVGQLLDLPVRSFLTAQQFLEQWDDSWRGCLVLDIKMPKLTGLELQEFLNQRGSRLPVIVVSGHADVRIAVEVMSRGALTLLEKPFRLHELTRHIREALKLDEERCQEMQRQVEAKMQLAQLTIKEREVLDLIVAGNKNKQIAEILQLSVRAVEDRRARLMKKLGARSIVDLLQLKSPELNQPMQS